VTDRRAVTAVKCVGIGISARYPISPLFTVVFANMFRVLSRPATLIFDNNYDIGVSRSLVVKAFMQTDCEKLIIVDTDIVPYKCTEEGDEMNCSVHYGALNDLIDDYSSYDIISIYHWSKAFVPNAFRTKKVEVLNDDVYLVEPEPLYLKPNSGVHQVDYSGIGITMIDRKVLEAIGFPWFKVVYTKLPDGRDYQMGEDVYFYMKAKERGFKAYVTTNILALHLGELALDLGNTARAFTFSWKIKKSQMN